MKILPLHGNKTWATQPGIHIHYHGMPAFHLLHGEAGAVLIFIPLVCFVLGVKACSYSVFEFSMIKTAFSAFQSNVITLHCAQFATNKLCNCLNVFPPQFVYYFYQRPLDHHLVWSFFFLIWALVMTDLYYSQQLNPLAEKLAKYIWSLLWQQIHMNTTH